MSPSGLQIGPLAGKDRVLDGRHQRDGMPETLVDSAEKGQAAALAIIFLFDKALDAVRNPPC